MSIGQSRFSDTFINNNRHYNNMDYVNGFYGRVHELELFNQKVKSNKAEFLVLYGRRRVGKTQLCLEFLKNKENKGAYFLATQEKEKYNISNFKKELAESLNDDIFLSLKDNWEDIFKYLSTKKERLTIVVDEFPYLIKSNSAVVSIFQRVWDLYLSKSNIFLVILGSSISIIENEVLSYQSPLYGRRTAQYNLQKLDFKTLNKFYPNYSFENLLLIFATLDTIPFYLNIFDKNISFYKNLEKYFFVKDSILYEEGDFLLKEEFKEIMVYKSILKEIAIGNTKFNEISLNAKIEKTKLTQYLKNLQVLRLIKKEVSFGEDILKSRKSIYSLNDNFLTFWFKYVLPNKDIIEKNKPEELVKIVQNNISDYLGYVFEQVVKEYMSIVFNISLCQRWWFKEDEIDLIGLNKVDDIMYFIECKYKKRQAGINVLEDLRKKSTLVRFKSKKKVFVIVSKSGFTNKLKISAKNQDDVILVSLKDLNNGFGF